MKKSQATAILILTIGFLLLSACAPADGQTTMADSSVAGANTTGNAEPTGETAVETLTQASQSEQTTDLSATAATAPLTSLSTKAEIVSLFNEAANRVKQTKPGYTFSSRASMDKNDVTVSDNVPFRSFIASFAASAVNSAKKDPVTVAKGASHDDFPVKGQPLASKIDETALTTATINQTGDYNEIELKFKDEKLPSLPEKNNQTAHGKAFSLLLVEDFRKEFGGFNTKFMGINIRVDNQKFEPTYSGSSIKCKIDKAGNMVSAVYYLNTTSDVDMLVKVNSKEHLIGIKLTYSMTETYSFG